MATGTIAENINYGASPAATPVYAADQGVQQAYIEEIIEVDENDPEYEYEYALDGNMEYDYDYDYDYPSGYDAGYYEPTYEPLYLGRNHQQPIRGYIEEDGNDLDARFMRPDPSNRFESRA